MSDKRWDTPWGEMINLDTGPPLEFVFGWILFVLAWLTGILASLAVFGLFMIGLSWWWKLLF
jgi:uncharacterized membrane protein